MSPFRATAHTHPPLRERPKEKKQREWFVWAQSRRCGDRRAQKGKQQAKPGGPRQGDAASAHRMLWPGLGGAESSLRSLAARRGRWPVR